MTSTNGYVIEITFKDSGYVRTYEGTFLGYTPQMEGFVGILDKNDRERWFNKTDIFEIVAYNKE